MLKPFSKGGWGALQAQRPRVDYLDLDSGKLKNGFNNNFTDGASPRLDQSRPAAASSPAFSPA